MEQVEHEPPPTSPPRHFSHIPGSPTHTTHLASNHFAGTSFGQQSREEYDYMGIQTALDDILYQLQDRNDIDAECDHLIRDMQR